MNTTDKQVTLTQPLRPIHVELQTFAHGVMVRRVDQPQQLSWLNATPFKYVADAKAWCCINHLLVVSEVGLL